jgi:hypothetical protein
VNGSDTSVPSPWRFATLADANGVGIEWPVLPSATPGLVVHYSMGDPGWVVTHERSGLCVAMFDTRDEAMDLAEELGVAGDWTRSGADIKADTEMATAARNIRTEADPLRQVDNRHPSHADWEAR